MPVAGNGVWNACWPFCCRRRRRPRGGLKHGSSHLYGDPVIPNPTQDQLEELETLIQRMLDLPVVDFQDSSSDSTASGHRITEVLPTTLRERPRNKLAAIRRSS